MVPMQYKLPWKAPRAGCLQTATHAAGTHLQPPVNPSDPYLQPSQPGAVLQVGNHSGRDVRPCRDAHAVRVLAAVVLQDRRCERPGTLVRACGVCLDALTMSFVPVASLTQGTPWPRHLPQNPPPCSPARPRRLAACPPPTA